MAESRGREKVRNDYGNIGEQSLFKKKEASL